MNWSSSESAKSSATPSYEETIEPFWSLRVMLDWKGSFVRDLMVFHIEPSDTVRRSRCELHREFLKSAILSLIRVI